MSSKDQEVQITTEGRMRANDQELRCRSCGGLDGWQATKRGAETVIVHACGAVQAL